MGTENVNKNQNQNQNNVSVRAVTPFALSFKAEVAKDEYKNKSLEIDVEELQGESMIEIEVGDTDYYLLQDEDAMFNRVFILNSGQGTEDIELEGEEKEEFLAKYEKEIEAGELELAQKIKKLIEESLEGKFFKREIKIYDEDVYNHYKFHYSLIYKSSYDFNIVIDKEDLELQEIPTEKAIVINGYDEIGQKIETDIVLVNQKYKHNEAQRTFDKYISDNQFEDQQDLNYYEVDIVTDKETIGYFADEKEGSFVFEGQNIQVWNPDMGCSDRQYIVE